MDGFIDRTSQAIADRTVNILSGTVEHIGDKIYHLIAYGVNHSVVVFINLIKSGALNQPLIVFSMVAIILWQLGARWQMKYVYWSWIFFFGVRWLCS